jgi:hypothetical protein
VLNGDLTPADLEVAERVVDARHGRLPLLCSALRRLQRMLDMAVQQVGRLKGRSPRHEPVVDQVLSHAAICQVHLRRLLEKVEVWSAALLEGTVGPSNLMGESYEVEGLGRRLLVQEQKARAVLDGLVQRVGGANVHKPHFLVDKGRIEQIYEQRYVKSRDLLLGRFAWRVGFAAERGAWSLALELLGDNREDLDFDPTPQGLDRLAERLAQLVSTRVQETWKESVVDRAREGDIPEPRLTSRSSLLPGGSSCRIFLYDASPGVFGPTYLQQFAPLAPDAVSSDPADPHASALVIAHTNLRFRRDLGSPTAGGRLPQVLTPEARAQQMEQMVEARGARIKPMCPSVVNLLSHPDRFATFLQLAMDGRIRQASAGGASCWVFSDGVERVVGVSGASLDQAVGHWVAVGADSAGHSFPGPDYAVLAGHVKGARVDSWPGAFSGLLARALPGVDSEWLDSAGVAVAGLLLDAEGRE